MKRSILISVIFGLFISTYSMAQERVSSLLCEGEGKAQRDRAELGIVKRYNTVNGKLTFEVSLKVQGEFEGEEREVSAATVVEADFREVNPLLPTFSVADAKDENRVTIKPLRDLLSSFEKDMPGNAVVVQLKTADPDAPYLVLKGIIGSYRSGDERTLNASVYSKKGKNLLSLGNADLRCSYQVLD